MKPFIISILVTLSVLSVGIFRADSPGCDWCIEAQELHAKGDCKEALSVLKKGLKGDAEYSEAYAIRALCQSELERPKQAAAALIEFFRLEPTREQIATVEGPIKKTLAQATPDNLSLELQPGVVAPVLLILVRASYPDMAVEAGIRASIVFDATIGVTGVPVDVSIRDSEQADEYENLGFSEATLNSVRSWRFFPGLRDGLPVPVKLTGIIKFDA